MSPDHASTSGAARKRGIGPAILAALGCLAGIDCAAAAAAPDLRQVDDSYTISRRHEAYRNEFPQLQLPALTLQSGQRILFERLYKQVGQRELHLDVFLPRAGRGGRQAIVLVHGGGWRSGNKSNFYAMANLLAQRGHVVVLPEFRLSPEAQYPAGLDDIRDAVEWVRQQAGELGVDIRRVAIGGESSGGQMAALLAYWKGAESGFNALIDLDGVLDFTTPLALQYENAAGRESSAARWLGGTMEENPERWREASPATHVGAHSPPTLIIAGGHPRFTAGKEAVIATLERHGIRHEYVVFEGAPHTFWLFDPHLGRVVDLIDRFLRAQRHAAPSIQFLHPSIPSSN